MLQYQEGKIAIRMFRIKMIIIYFLNVMDLICTRRLISTGLFFEANKLMAPIISEGTGTLLKIGLPAVMLMWLFFRIQFVKPVQMRPVKLMINSCLMFYIIINISHIIWLLSLL